MDFSIESPQMLIDTYVIPYGLNIIFALAIFFIGKSLVGLLTNLSEKLLRKAKFDEVLVGFISGIIQSLLTLFVIVAALGELGVDTTSLVALIGAAGLAVGLSLKSTLENFAAGVMLIMFRPFKPGDFVDIGGILGTVEKITIFTTQLKTGDNKEVLVPNGKIYGDVITNYSSKETRRVDMIFGIDYGDDIKKAKQVMTSVLEADKRILTDPAPLIAVKELGESSVNFVVRPWAKTEDYWDVYFDTHENIKLAFDREGITIPYPQRDVHLKQQ